MAAPALTLALAPQTDVTFALPPERGPRRDNPHAAVVPFAPGEAGTYHVALSAPAWLDVVQEGAIVPSAAFVSFTDCPGLRKIVAFDIGEDAFTLQISDAEAASIAVAIAPAR